jgi:hypothetical protein
MSIYHDDLIDQIEGLPKKPLYNERAAAVDLTKRMGQRYPQLLPVFIEALTAAGAWKEAAEITATAYGDIEDTTRTKPMRLHGALRKIACAYEAAIACGNMHALEELGKEWKATLTEIENDRQANKERRDPLHGVLGAH